MKRVYKDNYVGVGTLVSSQERRALAVSLINGLSTAGQPVVSRGLCFSIGLNRCRLFVLPKMQDSVFDSLERKREGFLLTRSQKGGFCWRLPVLSSPASSRRAAVPARSVRVLDSISARFSCESMINFPFALAFKI